METTQKPFSKVFENLSEDFNLKEQKRKPFFVHVDLHTMKSIDYIIIIENLRFSINALRYNCEDSNELKDEIKEFKRKFKIEENKWEKEAIDTLRELKKRFEGNYTIPIDPSVPINEENNLTKSYRSDIPKKNGDLMYKAGFRAFKNVRGDGNCYYRAVMCGFYETLIAGDDEKYGYEEGLIKKFIDVLESGIVGIKFNEREERDGKKFLKSELEVIADVKKNSGIKKGLHEFYLRSISDDRFNLV